MVCASREVVMLMRLNLLRLSDHCKYTYEGQTKHSLRDIRGVEPKQWTVHVGMGAAKQNISHAPTYPTAVHIPCMTLMKCFM